MHLQNQRISENSALQFMGKPSNQLIVQSSCIPYFPELAEKVGRSAAVFLQQLHYWTQKEKGKCFEGKRWIYNTYEQWAEQLKFSPATIRGVVRKLKSMGLIHTRRPNAQKGDQTIWYTLNYDAIKELGLPLFEEERKDPFQDFSFPQPCNDNRFEEIPLTYADNSRVLKNSTSLTQTNKLINKLSPADAVSDLNEMIRIWNQLVHRGKKLIQLTKRNIFKLKRRLERVFDGSIENWQAYCNLIASNDFLMGGGQRGWKATLHWALAEANIQKVCSGYYDQHCLAVKNDNPFCAQQKHIAPKQAEIRALIDKKTHLQNTLEHIRADVELERRRLTNKNCATLSPEARERYKRLFEEQNGTQQSPLMWNDITRSIFEMFIRAKVEEETFKETVDTYLKRLPSAQKLEKEIEGIDLMLLGLETALQALEREMADSKDDRKLMSHLLNTFQGAQLTKTLGTIVSNQPILGHA